MAITIGASFCSRCEQIQRLWARHHIYPSRAQGTLGKRRQKKNKSRRRWRTQINKVPGINEIKTQVNSQKPRQHAQGSSALQLSIVLWNSWLPTSGSLISVPFGVRKRTLSLCLFVLSNFVVLVFTLSYDILFYYFPLEAFFRNEKQKWNRSGLEGRLGVEGGKSAIMP